MMRRLLAVSAIGLGLGLSIPAIANAYPSYATASVNVRSGPGVGYARVGVLSPGTPVDIQFCQPAWCRVGYWGGVGWASARYLGGAAAPYPRNAAPSLYFRFNFGSPPPPPRRWPPPYPYRYPSPWWW